MSQHFGPQALFQVLLLVLGVGCLYTAVKLRQQGVGKATPLVRSFCG